MDRNRGQSGQLAAYLPPAQRALIVEHLSSRLRKEGRAVEREGQLLASIVDANKDPDALANLLQYVWARLRDDGDDDFSFLTEVAQIVVSQPDIVRDVLSRLNAVHPPDGPSGPAHFRFLRLLQQPGVLRVSSQVGLDDLLTLLLRADSFARETYADSQTTALLNLLSIVDVRMCLEPTENRSTHFGSLIWQKITLLLTDVGAKHRRYTGFLLWARWLHSPFDHAATANDDASGYWSAVRAGLLTGGPATQKICLYILRHSQIESALPAVPKIPSFKSHSSGSRAAESDQYCASFETIVIEQYPNQVQDRLSLLPDDILAHHQAGRHSVVEASWWFTLFTSALSCSSLDSIRAIIGKWVLVKGCSVQQIDDDCLGFMINGLLPWACQGQLFSKSISRHGKTAACKHGEALAHFIHNFFAGCKSISARDFYRHAILAWMHASWNKFNVHAAGYILLGLATSVQNGYKPSIETQSLVMEFFRTSHRSEIQQQLIEPSCTILAGSPVLETQDLGGAAIDGELALPADCDIQDILTRVTISDGRCFRGQQLRPFCQRLTQTLEQTSSVVDDLDYDQWEAMLSALWEEVEIQDYPRFAVTLVPSMLFYRIVQDTSANTVTGLLTPIQSTIMKTLLALSRGRIYIWQPLAKAVHGAFMRRPTLLISQTFSSFITGFLDGPPESRSEVVLHIPLAEATKKAHTDHLKPLHLDENLGHAYIFDIINVLDCDTSPAAVGLFRDLMKPWLDQTPPVPMISKWKRTSQLQAMTILVESVKSDPTLIAELRHSFMQILAMESLPRFRFLLEWIVTTLTRRTNASLADAHACPVLRQIAEQELSPTNPKYLASLLKIAIHIASAPEATEAYSEALFEHLVAMSASPKIVIRHEAQWQFLVLYNHAQQRGWQLVSNSYLASLHRFIRSLEKAMATPLARQLEGFNIDRDRTVCTLFEGGYLNIEPPEQPLFTSEDYGIVVATQNTAETDRVLSFESVKARPTDNTPSVIEATDDHAAVEIKILQKGTESLKYAASSVFQTKAKTTQFLDIPSHLLDSDTGLTVFPIQAEDISSPQMILVASLVDSAFNLGGLSRAAEIFGCSELHVDHAAIVKDKAFTALSVSSETHLRIVETKAQPPRLGTSCSLLDMLRAKKDEGWTVVGIEQTSTSFVLGEYTGQQASDDNVITNTSDGSSIDKTRLPRRVVFVLGAEKTGLPGWLLPWMDDCAEIRQHGVTRSLNVQTAAAIVMWEWRRVYRAGS